MKPWTLGAALVAGLSAVSLTSLCRTPAQAQAGSVTWLSDFDQAAAQAKKRGKPIFLTFRCER